MTKSLAFISLSLAALVGCGGDEPKKPVITVDAPGSGSNQVDAPTSGACTTQSNWPALALQAFDYTADADDMTAGNQESWSAGGLLEQGTVADALIIGFYEGPPPAYSVADYPPAPLTIQLTGPEADATKCSTCVVMLTDVNTANMMELEYAHDFQAKSGTVNLTALSPTKITGTITGLTLRHVNADFMAGTQTDDPDGCTTAFGDITFDVVPTMAKRADGKVGYGIKLPTRNRVVRSL